MSDRKYRQRGYQDDDRREPASRAPRPPAERREGPKTPNMMGFRQVVRCARCGHVLSAAIAAESTCPKCGVDLHTCSQCASFDPGSRFECMQTIPARVSPKDARNACALFDPRVTTERQTGSAGPPDARRAFDDLFK